MAANVEGYPGAIGPDAWDYRVTIAQWETGRRGIPSFLPLTLEALEHRMKEEGKHGPIGGVPGLQKP